MKFKFTALLLAAVLLLTGCSWMDGEYVSVVPHQEPAVSGPTGAVSASDYHEIIAVPEELVLAGSESCVIDVGGFPQKTLDTGMQSANRYIREVFPMGAYAVESITYEVGVSQGRPAIAVSIAYRRSKTEIQRIRKKADMESLAAAVHTSLDDHASLLTVLVSRYEETDFDQLVHYYFL